jgi:hypothetical protein
MRRLHFDDYEFDPRESEQSLEVAISSSRQHPNLGMFLTECGSSAIAGPPISPGWARLTQVSDHLRMLAGLELPHPSRWRESVLLRNEWDDLELGIAAGPVLVWYHWFTTA